MELEGTGEGGIRPDLSRCHHSNNIHDNKSVLEKTPGIKSQLYIHTMPGARSDHRPPKTSAACFLSTIHPSFLSSFLYSLQGWWNSEAGRGVQCVVSKFRMYFRA